MDIPLYKKFLHENPAEECRQAHLDPGEGFVPNSGPKDLTGQNGLALQQGVDLMAPAADPLGSWTGVPADPYEVPEQDADDL